MAGRPAAVVIGAGVGGLAAAIDLARAGCAVTVVERALDPGGKAGTATVDGATFDTGPSVLTLPDVFDALLRDAGTALADELSLVRPSPAFRYVWPDGASVDVEVAPEATLASVRASLGERAEAELAGFLAYAADIWRVAGPRFVRGPAPTPWSLLSFAALRELSAIDPFRSMDGAIRARVTDPHVRDVLLRYATYAGSDPRRAPATLHCIAHVELALGGFGVRGGISALVDALVRVGGRLGVGLRCGAGVERIKVHGGAVVGVETAAGDLHADLVVSNADHAATEALLGRPAPVRPTSTSGWTGVFAARRAERRPAHLVAFPSPYDAEFVDLFDRRRVPVDPTIYACAQSVCHLREGWPDREPMFVMVNAPPVGDTDDPALEGMADHVRARLGALGVLDDDDPLVWQRTPRGLAERFPGSGGALYGAALDGPLGPMRRPGNRVRGVRGLYAAGGTVHPGGGLPLAVLSGRAAAAAAAEDFGWKA